VELDHRALAAARPDLDLDSWGRVLRDAGVTQVPLADAGPGVAGRAVEDAREARRLVEALEVRAAEAPGPLARLGLMAPLVGASVIAMVMGATLTGTVLLLGAAVASVVQRKRQADREQGRTAELLRQRRELHSRARALAGRTFVALLGDDTLVINTPHLSFLESRIHDVDRAWGRMLDRDRAVARLRDEMVASNRILGREELDAEVLAIDAERARIQESEPAFKALRDELEAKLHKARENVEYLAEVGRRQALSHQLGGVMEHAVGDPLAELAGTLEIDVAWVEAELARLDVALSDADASLRAVLEVEAVVRQQ